MVDERGGRGGISDGTPLAFFFEIFLREMTAATKCRTCSALLVDVSVGQMAFL